MVSKAHIEMAVVTLVTVALVAMIQRNVMPVPVVGDYLPK